MAMWTQPRNRASTCETAVDIQIIEILVEIFKWRTRTHYVAVSHKTSRNLASESALF